MSRCHFCGEVSNGTLGPLKRATLGTGVVLAHPFCTKRWSHTCEQMVKRVLVSAMRAFHAEGK